MKIILNGVEQVLDGAGNIEALLEREGFGGMLVAVARNGAFVAKDTYGDVQLEDGDEIEVVSPMQGG